jgi:serine protease Do
MTHPQPRPPYGRSAIARLGVAALAAGVIAWTTAAGAALPTEGYADLVEKISPAVVFISSTHTAPDRHGMNGDQQDEPNPFPPGSPFGEFFKHFQEQAPRQPGPMTALGSGFLIDSVGDIVTNNHVIDGADTVKVKLQDGREFDAKVVGTDTQTDLALLKVEFDEPLPAVAFGDSDTLRVGDVVLAVGNPFGLGGTVTAGIVSARNRNISAGPYDDFIQTDAAINRGNSGGPLFNTQGQVVGVNTAIYSPNGGSVGIGFALPSNLVKDVVAQLQDHGSVSRGWLGVKVQAITPDIAKAVGLDEAKGALVTDVTAKSPAEAAGIKQGDVIVGFAGKPVTSMRELPRLVAGTRAGSDAKVELWRDGQKKTVTATIADLKPETVAARADDRATPGGTASKTLGADLAALDDDAKAQLNLPEDTTGVVVTAVDPDGRAAAVGLRPGDVIRKVGLTAVATPADVNEALAKAEQNNAVLLLIDRGGEELFVGLKLSGA